MANGVGIILGGGGGSGGGGGASPLTTKGDVYTYSTTDARLPVGANGTVLTADSGETTGLKWAAVAGTGDVTAAAAFSTDNRLIRSDGTAKGVQASGVTLDDSANMTGVNAITVNTAGLKLLDTNASHALVFTVGTNLTAERTFTLTTGDANRALTVSSDTTLGGGSHSGTNTGDQTITLTGDVTGAGTGSFAATIAADAVTNAKMANMATQTIKGRTTAGTGDPEDLTATQATAILDAFVGDSGSGGTKGLVPAPTTGDATKFLKGDGTWATISGGASPLTTKGDIYTYSTTDDRLGVGSNGQVLTADSAEATGLKWTTVSGTGDVTAASSFGTDNVLIRSDGTGKGVQSSGIVIDDTDHITIPSTTNQIVLGTTNTTTFSATAPAASRTVTFADPGGNDSVAYLAATQTLTNKTISTTNTITALDSTFTIVDNGDNTKVVAFQCSGITTATTRTLTVPNASGTIALTTDLDNTKIDAIKAVLDGGGSAITTGVKVYAIRIPYACTINSATVLADQTGSIVLDIWKDTYANYPPTGADSITASAKPTLSSATKSEDTTLTGWTTSVAAGDILRINVDSATTVTWVELTLKVTKT